MSAAVQHQRGSAIHIGPIAIQGELEPGVKGPFCGRWISDMAVECGTTGLLIVDEALSHVVVVVLLIRYTLYLSLHL